MMRLYLSCPCVWTVTSFPKARAEAACLVLLPYAWPFSGQSMPPRRMRSARWLCRPSKFCCAEMVFPQPPRLLLT